jgi:hypothetical protein
MKSTHAWVHDGCWRAWRVGRKAEAVAELKALGIAPAENFGESGT